MAFKLVGIGEVLWDLLPMGPQLGGAPANFAHHAQALGADACVITRVGNDGLGREVIRRFQQMRLPEETVQMDEVAPTGSAEVKVSGDGLAHFTIQENVAWDFLAADAFALEAVGAAHAICFGSLAQRHKSSRAAICSLVGAASAEALVVFDINLRQEFYSATLIEKSLRQANVLKMNEDELPVLAAMFDLDSEGADSSSDRSMEAIEQASVRQGTEEPNTRRQITNLARKFGLRVVGLTRGANGSLLYENVADQERWSECASRPVHVVDTVGAGDAFTAALILGLLGGMDLDEINDIANEVARYVCSQPGATPRLPDEFANRFRVEL